MISPQDITAVGRILKTHGIDGEMVVSVDREIPSWDDLRCIVLYIDGIAVPFFINSWRPKGAESDLITLDGINSEKEARALCGLTVYILRGDLAQVTSDDDSEDGFYADDLVGFRAFAGHKQLGEITSLDSSTANCLFIIDGTDGREILVPVAPEMIADIDTTRHKIIFDLPDGLID